MNLKNLISNFENNLGRFLSPFEIEDLQKWVVEDGYSMELINEALRIAVRGGKKNFKYINGILRNQRERGLLTVADVRAAEEDRHQVRTQPRSLELVDGEIGMLEAMIAAAELWGSVELRRWNVPSLEQAIQTRLEERKRYV